MGLTLVLEWEKIGMDGFWYRVIESDGWIKGIGDSGGCWETPTVGQSSVG